MRNLLKVLYRQCSSRASSLATTAFDTMRGKYLGIWSAAIGLLLVQAFLPLAIFWIMLKWTTMLQALERGHDFWPAQAFLASYGVIAASGTLAGVFIKTAIKRHPGSHRMVVSLIASLGCYIFVFFMARVILEVVKLTPGHMDVFLIFYFGFYLLFLGWTTKPIWDRVTDDGMKALYRRLYGADPS